MEFSYFMPVRLLFGANVIDQLGATAKSYGTHALIVTAAAARNAPVCWTAPSPCWRPRASAPRYSIRWSPTP